MDVRNWVLGIDKTEKASVESMEVFTKHSASRLEGEIPALRR